MRRLDFGSCIHGVATTDVLLFRRMDGLEGFEGLDGLLNYERAYNKAFVGKWNTKSEVSKEELKRKTGA